MQIKTKVLVFGELRDLGDSAISCPKCRCATPKGSGLSLLDLALLLNLWGWPWLGGHCIHFC